MVFKLMQWERIKAGIWIKVFLTQHPWSSPTHARLRPERYCLIKGLWNLRKIAGGYFLCFPDLHTLPFTALLCPGGNLWTVQQAPLFAGGWSTQRSGWVRWSLPTASGPQCSWQLPPSRTCISKGQYWPQKGKIGSCGRDGEKNKQPTKHLNPTW